MKRLSVYQIAIVLWLFLLYNIERLIAPINIASFVYVYVAVIAVAIFGLPLLQDWSVGRLFLLVLVPFFLLKLLLGYQIAGQNLAITITEMALLYGTLGISNLLMQEQRAILDEIKRLALGDLSNSVSDFSVGQAELYREVRRARRYNRPATLLIVHANSGSTENYQNRITEEMRAALTKNYTEARFASLLQQELKNSDVITKTNDGFIILLPETTHEQAPLVINRIKNSAQNDLGLELQIGSSTFPGEAVTFAGLVEKAETSLQSSTSDVQVHDGESHGATEFRT